MDSITAAHLDEFLSDLRVLCGRYGACIDRAFLTLDVEGDRVRGYRTEYFRDLTAYGMGAHCIHGDLHSGHDLEKVDHYKDLRHRL